MNLPNSAHKEAFRKMHMTLTHKRILAVLLVLVYFGGCALLFLYIGKPFIEMLDEPGRFQAWVASHGIAGPLLFLFMMILQVFVAVMPGEPLEIAAGYTFGWLHGTLLCVIGMAVGQMIVFLLIKKFGMRALELFIPREKIRSVKFIRQSGSSFRLLFLLFFIPGTPKDLLTYCAGLMDIDLRTFLIVTTIARLPSVVTSTIGGNALGDGNYLFAAIVFVVTAAVSLGGLLLYSKVKKKVSERKNGKIPQDPV